MGVPLAAAAGAPDAPADGDGWSGSSELERKLAAFEDAATEAGALGFYRDEVTSTLVIVLPADLPAEAAITISELPAPVPVTSVTSRLRTLDLKSIASAISALPGKLATDSDSIAYFFNPEKGLVTLSTTLPADELSSVLGDLWQYIDYHHAEVQNAGRFTDASPFKGGAAFDVINFGLPDWDCTTGFTVVNAAGTKGLVSAAHCGDGVHNAVQTAGGSALGTIVDRHCPHAQHADFELITGKAYNEFIYVGTTAAGSTIEVSEAGQPAAGATYRFSGAASYEHTNQKVISTSVTYQSSAATCGVADWVTAFVWTRYRTYDETCDVRSGDSGGPFYLTYAGSPGTVGIRGLVTASDDTYCYGIAYPFLANQLGYNIYLH